MAETKRMTAGQVVSYLLEEEGVKARRSSGVNPPNPVPVKAGPAHRDLDR